MKKALVALVAVGTIGLTVAATTHNADAQRRHHHHGGGIAAGIIGGLAAGAIIAGATQPRYYEPAPAYGAYGPGYYGPPRACIEQQYVWSNRRGDYVLRDVRVPC